METRTRGNCIADELVRFGADIRIQSIDISIALICGYCPLNYKERLNSLTAGRHVKYCQALLDTIALEED